MPKRTPRRPRVWSYRIQRIPDALMKRVRHQAVDEGLTIRDLILKALERYCR